jgi:excisionase family DNA binding protein
MFSARKATKAGEEGGVMLTYKELASWWSVPLGTIYSWVSRGRIPHVRLADRSVRFEREALEEWLAERRMKA